MRKSCNVRNANRTGGTNRKSRRKKRKMSLNNSIEIRNIYCSLKDFPTIRKLLFEIEIHFPENSKGCFKSLESEIKELRDKITK